MKLLGLLCTVVQVCALVSASALPIRPKGPNSVQFLTNKKRYYDYSDETIRGVNLGGWLLLEPYITPSLFEAFRTNPHNDDGIPVDEYHYCKFLGKEVATDRLVAHWSTFYQEIDFQHMKEAGLNLVRIPIGYWAFATLPNDPYVTGLQEEYLDRAIEWARENDLKVWVDLHGAAGSQNGFDNSGLRDHYGFLEKHNMDVTMKALKHILEKYSRVEYEDVVIGVEVLNEPLGTAFDMEMVKKFYYEAYDYLRHELGRNQILAIHDAFMSPGYWNDEFTLDKGYWGVVLDHHHYQVFSLEEVKRNIDEHIQVACQWGKDAQGDRLWNVAGEWSAALTDCAKWLNGVGIGARWDGTFHKGNQGSEYNGSCEGSDNIETWSEEFQKDTRRYVEAQMEAFESTGGWIFWCYKTETAIEWSMQKLIYYGMFPNPVDQRIYGWQCSYPENEAKSKIQKQQ